MLHVSDLALQRGYGIFDFFKTLNGHPVCLEDHLERFYQSAAAMRLDPGKSKEELRSVLFSLMEKNRIADSGIKITLTGGNSENGYSLGTPNLVITQIAVHMNHAFDQTGIRLMTYPHLRQLPAVKTTDYLMAIWLQPYIAQNKADDVLYHQNGILTETPRANIFFVTQNNTILTPQHNILQGITRKQVLNLVHNKFEVMIRDISLQETELAKEAFITSTTKQVMPVVSIDGKQIGNGKPGAITEAIYQLLIQSQYGLECKP
jgi:D-alanine transaminase/branched-chain amino acid aminotransferase